MGAPDPRLGERICAVVTRDDSAQVSLETIDAAFRVLGVARQKTPEFLVIFDEYPRTPSGKVQKAEPRRDLAAQGHFAPL